MENIYLCLTSWSLPQFKIIQAAGDAPAASAELPLARTSHHCPITGDWCELSARGGARFGQDGTHNNPPKAGPGLRVVMGNSNATVAPAPRAQGREVMHCSGTRDTGTDFPRKSPIFSSNHTQILPKSSSSLRTG